MSLNRRIGVELDIEKALKDAERLEQKLLNIGKSSKGAGGFGTAIAKEMRKAEESSKKTTEVITSEQKKQFSAFNKFNSLRDKSVKDSTANQIRQFSKQLAAIKTVNKAIEKSNKEEKKSAQQVKESKTKEIAASRALEKQLELEALANAEAKQSVANYAKNSNDLSIQLDKTTQQTLNSIKVSDLKAKKQNQLAVATDGLLDLERALVRESGIYNAAVFKTVQLQDKLKNATSDTARAQIQAQLVRQKSVANLAKYNFELARSRKELALSKIQAGSFAGAVEATGIASARSVGGIRAIRGAAGQLGFQIQDIAVQAQMGTNALVILGQQGSQVLSLLGSAGQIAGAGLAVFAAVAFSLAPKALNAKDATEQLAEAQEKLAESFDLSEGSVDGYSEKLIRLAEISESAAQLQLIGAILEAEKQMKLAAKSTVEFADSLDNIFEVDFSKIVKFASNDAEEFNDFLNDLTNNVTITGNKLGNFQVSLVNISEELGLSGREGQVAAAKLAQLLAVLEGDPSVESLDAVATTLNELQESGDGASDEMVALFKTIGDAILAMQQGEDASAQLKKAIEELGESAKNTDLNTAFSDFVFSLQEEVDAIGKSNVQLALREAWLKKVEQQGAANAELTQLEIDYITDLVETKKRLNDELEEEERLRSQSASFQELLDNYREETSLVGMAATQIELYNAAKAKGSALTEAETNIILENIEAKRQQLDLESSIESVRNNNSSLESTINKYEKLIENYGKSNEQLAIEQAIIQAGSASDPRVNNLEALIAKYRELQDAREASENRSSIIGSIETDTGISEREIADKQLSERLSAIESANADELGLFASKQEAKIAAEEEYYAIIDELDREASDKRKERMIALANQAASALQAGIGALSSLAEIEIEQNQRSVDSIKEKAKEQENLTETQRSEYNKQIAAEEKAAKKKFETNKKLRVADAIVSTAAGVMNAFNIPEPITAALQAASVAATGAAQIAKIKSQQFGGLGGGIDKPKPPAQRAPTQSNDNSFNGNVEVKVFGSNISKDDMQDIMSDLINRDGKVIKDIKSSGEYRL